MDLSKIFSDPYLMVAILAGACIVFPKLRDFLTGLIQTLIAPAPKQIVQGEPLRIAQSAAHECSPMEACQTLLLEFATRGNREGLTATVDVMRHLGYVAPVTQAKAKG